MDPLLSKSAPPTILVVDDSPDVRDILRLFLEDEGFRVLLARDGREALRKATMGVTVIILDVHMPGLDGLDICKMLQESPCTKEIPVLILSALGPQIAARAHHSGAYDWLSKPVRLGDLLVKVKALAKLVGWSGSLAARMAYSLELKAERARQEQKDTETPRALCEGA